MGDNSVSVPMPMHSARQTPAPLRSTAAAPWILISTNAGINSRALNVTGTGYDGNGALVSNGLSDINNSFLGVNLAGPTTFGGSARWDIRGTAHTLAGNGYTLTKTGTN